MVRKTAKRYRGIRKRQRKNNRIPMNIGKQSNNRMTNEYKFECSSFDCSNVRTSVFLVFTIPYPLYLYTFLLLTAYCLLSIVYCFSQSADRAAAKQFFDSRNYSSALKTYQLLLQNDANNIEYNHKAAQCYLLSNVIKQKAIVHLERIIRQKKYPDEVWLDLGKAYHSVNRFDRAIRAYETYREKQEDKKDKKEIASVSRFIEQCHNGKELVKRPLKVTYENLGKNINCEFPDFYPVVSPDESVLYFTARRKSPTAKGPEFDGFYPSDIFTSTMKGGKWGKAQSIGSIINTNLDEQVVDISNDGNILLFYIDHIEEFGDIWITRRPNDSAQFLEPEPLPENINSGMETSASIFKDPVTGNETLLLASSRSGTADNPNYGETDIYSSRKLSNGQWSEPQNLGPNINTPYKEDFPRFSEGGKTLYFASQGHSSMGGFDVFKSAWDKANQTWSAPKNLGYPINNADDNLTISPVSGGKMAYVSAVRKNGIGDLDIYKVILEDVGAKETLIKGYIIPSDTLDPKVRNAKIKIIDKKTNKQFGVYIPDPNSCYYVIECPPGRWIMTVEAKGYEAYTEEIIIFSEILGFSSDVTKNIKLKKSP